MKITASQLRRIIKEEVSKLMLEYEQSIVRRGSNLYLVDDEGNEEPYGSVLGSGYEHLDDGDAEPYEAGGGRGYNYGVSSGYGRRRRRW